MIIKKLHIFLPDAPSPRAWESWEAKAGAEAEVEVKEDTRDASQRGS
jgi:hypothetical protein